LEVIVKILTILIPVFIIFMFVSCSQEETNNREEKLIWKGEPGFSFNAEDINQEIAEKEKRLQKFLTENNLEGMLFTQVRNVNWITAGQVNTQIVLNKDAGAASFLIMKDGKKYVLANGSEIPRLMDESLTDLNYEVKQYNWYEANPMKDVRQDLIKEVASTSRIGSDVDFPGTINVAESFRPVRYSLTENEIKRYRWLGEQCTEAVAEVCKRLEPGMNEFEIESMTAAELRSRGIMPTVLLMGVDDRIYNYRHALPGGAVLEKYAMVNIVAEKWGMPIAVTRFVHFGELPGELKDKLQKTAVVNARYEEATAPGTPVSEIFEKMKDWYKVVGFEGEWQKHHQGGAIGYDDREYVIYPGNKNVIQENQAFAWNPTITGAKVEETIIAMKDHAEVITKSEGWPMINVELNGKVYPQPAILVKDPSSGEIIEQKTTVVKAE
jgi:Xaa-Pro dipeptidase